MEDKDMTILYTEEVLNKVYRIYAKHQGMHGVPFISLKDFREMFEAQQRAIYKQHIDEIEKIFNDYPNNRFDN